MVKLILDGVRKFVRRIKRAFYVLIGKEVEVVSVNSEIYNLLERQTTDFNNQSLEDKFSKIEQLLHYLATRVEILAREQREMKEGQVKQNSNVEELLNSLSTANYNSYSETSGYEEMAESDYEHNLATSKKPVLN